MTDSVKYSDVLVEHLVELGYTHCFFLGGGNVMHLIESARTRMECVAVVHEVSAGIAAEYFNVAMREQGKKAVVFVTAGPGLTNLITAIGGAWLESRELLVIGGQARTEFLSRGTVRQIGHQEIDGVGITSPITKASVTIEKPMMFSELKAFSDLSASGRKGPVFIELCLDVSATYVNPAELYDANKQQLETESNITAELPVMKLTEMWSKSQRPLLLVGQGLSYSVFQENYSLIEQLKLPTATSWNAADYLDFNNPLYAGRPNTYGMRWANAVIQQCDLLIVVGARLGLQQTGFNWEEFAPLASVIHVDIDPLELNKSNPRTDLNILGDANLVLPSLLAEISNSEQTASPDWAEHIAYLKKTLPVNEPENALFPDKANPFEFISELSDLLADGENCLIPCSSGGSYTTVMQSFKQKRGQLLTNDKGLASMGYGLAGAIGTSIALPEKNVVLVEGDGGFAQNLNEVGTVANRKLNLKMVIFDNGGYASIRLSQRAYFDGNYIGCDDSTGIGLPHWESFFSAYGIPVAHVTGSIANEELVKEVLLSSGPGAVIVHIDKEQPFFPKLTSRIFPDGTMKSNPLHIMMPSLTNDVADKVFKYLPENFRYAE
ncbi:thiamine pyrophosphate-binding protein [Aurantimicrobium minutum]|uniref:thiamine pyrophosphate-binding protein n=1 Tax=Aurantimicrobium minutum TaxID=708131 RepID=UPI0024768474|nr:thiamine pyrophosphate-binding protein [Aurantimicrobium minutum]MDH6537267.1 acetolactate synthase-1/2/3 large subunit [Aurantimicrobium minutum]